jgi:type II secretory pathway pseudopilin PulG
MNNSGRRLVAVLVVIAAATLVTVVIRERNKKTMFALYADVHNLATAQAAYFTDNGRYSPVYPAGYQPTHGASVSIVNANDTSWSATATHPRTSRICRISYAQPMNATQQQMVDARTESWKEYDCR